MAKNKVINTVLNLRDNMSGGLLKAAQNAKKAGAQINNDMLSATRQVVAFKNKAVDGITSFAKTAVGVGVAGATALTTAFIALDGATEEYRIAMGKLNTAYESAGYSAQTATQAYRDFYGILGDVDTATEASQLLAKLAENEQDVSTWTRIAAGVSGTFGDSLPVEGLIEAANETAKVGTVTGQLADALNWGTLAGEKFGVALKADTEANEDWNKAVLAASSAEDYFNLALESCGSEAERNKLIMDTLARGYESAADAFYKNNKQVIDARRNQATLDEITAKLGDTSALVKNRLWEMFGAAEDGSLRGGSALAWLNEKADQFSGWVASFDISSWTTQFDQGFATVRAAAGRAFDWIKTNVVPVASALKDAAVEAFGWMQENVLPKVEGVLGKAADAFEWMARNMDKVGPVLEGLVKLWAASKVAKFGTDVLGAGNDLWQFGKTIFKVAGTDIPKAGSKFRGGFSKVLDGGLKISEKLGTGIVKLGGFFGKIIGKVGGVGKALLGLAAAHPVITAIIAAAGLIITNWDKIKPVLESLWNKAKEVFGAIRDWAVDRFNAIKDTATNLLTSIKDTFTRIKDAIAGAFNSAKDAVGSFFSWIGDKLSWLDNKVESIPILGSVYKGGKALVGGAADFIGSLIGGNALGTSYWKGGLTRVGERGGEILNLPSGTQIIPHDVSKRVAGGQTVQVYVTVQGNIIGNRQYADELGETIVQRILRALDNM